MEMYHLHHNILRKMVQLCYFSLACALRFLTWGVEIKYSWFWTVWIRMHLNQQNFKSDLPQIEIPGGGWMFTKSESSLRSTCRPALGFGKLTDSRPGAAHNSLLASFECHLEVILLEGIFAQQQSWCSLEGKQAANTK